MFKKELMDQELLMIVVIVEKELMVLSNLDHILIKNYQKDKRQFLDHMEEFYVQDVSSLESLEPFYYRKLKLLKRLKE